MVNTDGSAGRGIGGGDGPDPWVDKLEGDDARDLRLATPDTLWRFGETVQLMEHRVDHGRGPYYDGFLFPRGFLVDHPDLGGMRHEYGRCGPCG